MTFERIANLSRFMYPFCAAMASDVHSSLETRANDGFLTSLAKKHPSFLFFILAYTLGWGMVTPRVLSWLGILPFNVPDWWVIASFYAPCVAGLWMQWLTKRNLRVCRLYESWRTLLLGIAVGSFLVLICNTVVPALLAEKAAIHTLSWKVFFSLASYRLYYADLLTPVGEEIGWRGYALPRLQMRFGPVWASVLVGLMWAGFMLPALTMVQMWMSSFIVMYAISLVAISIEVTFAMNLSGFSIIVAVVMNTLAGARTGYLSRGLIAHASPRPHWEWIWSVSSLLVPVFLVLVTRGRLAARSLAPIVDGQALSRPQQL